ncbi:MAG: hypothetical protein COA43_14210 [Robiginitomaculum sp.]|nr:MAG: hypothetical protein COA43_14210 [Robiginitomaculum sp.]
MMKNSIVLSVLVCSSLMSGCAHITGEKGLLIIENPANVLDVNQSIPPNWQEGFNADLPKTLLWSDFNDPVLQGLIKTGLTNNLTLKSVALNLQSALITLESVNASTKPNLSLGSGNVGLSQGRRGGVNQSYSLRASGSYQFDLWGRLKNSMEQTELALGNSETAIRAARITVAQTITQLYLDIRVQDEFIRLQNQQIEIQQEQLRLSEVRLKAGAITRLNVDQIDVNIQRLRSRLNDLHTSRVNLQRSLSIVLGQSSQRFELPETNFSFVDILRLQPSSPLEVIFNRPDIERAERAILRADISLDTARKAWLPSLSLSSGAELSGTSISKFLTLDALSASIGESLSILLYDNGNRRRSISRSVLAREQAVLAYEKSILASLQDIERVLGQQSKNIRQIEIQELQQESQDRVTRIIQAQYDTGVASAFDLIREQSNALNARQSRITNWRSGMQSSISILVALGIEP